MGLVTTPGISKMAQSESNFYRETRDDITAGQGSTLTYEHMIRRDLN